MTHGRAHRGAGPETFCELRSRPLLPDARVCVRDGFAVCLPPPEGVAEPDARTERTRWRDRLPDGVNVEGAYITAVRTWGVIARPHVKSGA